MRERESDREKESIKERQSHTARATGRARATERERGGGGGVSGARTEIETHRDGDGKLYYL